MAGRRWYRFREWSIRGPRTLKLKAELITALIVLALAGMPPSALAGAPASPLAGTARLADPGSFAATGSMHAARASFVDALLSDGDVLVAGGDNSASTSSNNDSAELYDPSTGKWTETGSMHLPRAAQALTLLPDGHALTSGGYEYGSLDDGTAIYTATAEMWNPSTGEWREVGSMRVPRAEYYQALLDDGRVLACGGLSRNTDVTTNTCELFDPDSDQWSETGSLPSKDGLALGNGPLLELTGGVDEGEVMFAGGEVNGSVPVKQSELYDPATGQWTLTGEMSEPRAGFRTTLLGNGEVLASGGVTTGGADPKATATAELYNPTSARWTPTGSMNEARTRHTATLLADGTVLVTGGRLSGNYVPTKTAEIYDPDSGKWYSTGSMPDAVANSQAQLLNTGQVLVAGGFGLGLVPTNGAWLYNGPSLSVGRVSFQRLGRWRLSQPRAVTFTDRGPRRIWLQTRLGGRYARQFQIAGRPCRRTLLPGQKCTIRVCFAPRAIGAFSARVVVRVRGGMTLWTSLRATGQSAGTGRPRTDHRCS